MKKVTLLMLGLLIATSLKADWKQYRVDSDLAKQALNRVETLKNLSGTAEYQSDYAFLLYGNILHNYAAVGQGAKELGREDLQAWAKNNAAYASILYFKWLVKYEEKTTAINALNPKSKERLALVKELQESYAANIALLENPLVWLSEAEKLNTETTLIKRVKSNRNFITGVKKFISQKF